VAEPRKTIPGAVAPKTTKPAKPPRVTKPLTRSGKPSKESPDSAAVLAEFLAATTEPVVPIEVAPPSLADTLLVRPTGKPAGVVVIYTTQDVEETHTYLKVERVGGARRAMPNTTYVSKDVIAGLGYPAQIRITIEAVPK
jgi:hypothetical protein